MAKCIGLKRNLWKLIIFLIVVTSLHTLSFISIKNKETSQKWLNVILDSMKNKTTGKSIEVNHDFNINLQNISKSTLSDTCSLFIFRRRSFPSIPNCTNYTTRLCEEGTFNLTALVSYPGSGNTWVRHLIEIATGYFTGSVYFDHTLYARGFLGEKEDWSSGSTIVQKLHVKFDKKQNFNKGILIIRDPIAATRSFVDYMESGHTGRASPTTFHRKEWPMFLLKSTNDWMLLAKTWIESPLELLVIHYENLMDSTEYELQKILKFLKLDESRMKTKCFQKSTEGSFHRKTPRWKVEMIIPNKVKLLIMDGVNYVNSLLVSRGLESIPIQKYELYNTNFHT